MAGFTEWCEMSQKNRMQTNTLLGGMMTLALGGTFMGVGIFNLHLRSQTWTFGQSEAVILIVICLFHLAAVVGSFATVFFVERVEKLLLSRIYLFLVAVASILKIIVPTSIYGIMFSRILGGLAFGMAYLVVLIHGGEVITKQLRGTTMAACNYVIFLGVLAHVAISPVSITEYSAEPSRIIGIAGVMSVLMAVLIGEFMSYESPVFLVRQNRDVEAIRNLMKLRLESTENTTVQAAYIEIRMMLQEDSLTSMSILADGNWRPLVLISLGKIAAVLSFNAAVNEIRLVVVDETFGLERFSISGAVILSIRIILGVLFLFTLDKCGRKPHQIMSAFFSGAMLIVMGVVYLAVSTVNVSVATAVFLTYELVASVGVYQVPDVHLSEAFSTRKKALSIATVLLVENAAQVAIIASTFYCNFAKPDLYGGVLLGCGIPLVVIAVVLYVYLPETAQLSLRQSRAAFAQVDAIYGPNKELYN